MELGLRCILFLFLKYSALAEMAIYKEARLKASTDIMPGDGGKSQIPDKVCLDVITDDEMFSFNLKRNTRQHRKIPVITHAGDTLKSRVFEMHKKGTGLFYMANATFILRFTNGHISSGKGFFYNQDYVYTVKPDSGNVTSHWLLKSHYNTFNFSAEENFPGNEEVLPVTKSHRRRKRQTRLYEIELFIVVDFALFSQLTSFKHATSHDQSASEEELEDIVHQFAVIVSGIDARLRGIQGSGYVLDVIFAGIYIAQTESSSSWVESIKEDTFTRPVVNEKAVKRFIDWMKRNQHLFPEFDHAMAFTAYNLRKEDNLKTLGLGYTQSICTDRRYSIVEHHGDAAYVSYIATHELAHSLGAKHDGYPSRVVYGEREKMCRADEGYIMCPKASRDPDTFVRKWQFSDCSLLYFDFFIDHLNENRTNCLTKRSSFFDGKDSTVYIEEHPSVYSPDEQCERKHGEKYVLDRKSISENSGAICHSLPCINPGARDTLKPTLPLEGTVCGHQKVCHLGRCVDSRSSNDHDGILPKDDACVFGDQPGVIAGTEQNCEDLVGEFHLAYKCYMYEQQCCRTCSQHRRYYKSIENCRYGDRKSTCSAADCDSDVCCETCAALAGEMRECQNFNAHDHVDVTFSTDKVRPGTVASFLCKNDHHLTGNRTTICLEDGIWDSAAPKCIRGCLLPTFPNPYYTPFENTADSVVEFGSLIRIKCKHGFLLEGNHTLECTESTPWVDIFPKCTLGFTSPSMIYISENVKSGSVVHQLSTGNASSMYRLVYFSHPGFKVTLSGSVETEENSEIDFESVQGYTLIIEATSTQDQRFKAKQRLIINVQDVNEFKPTFQYERYCATLYQPFTKGMFVFTASATDKDSSVANISYRIRTSSDIADIFQINSLTGDITVANAERLNNSEKSDFMLKIIAEDSGSPKLTGISVVQVSCENECHLGGATGVSNQSFQIYLTCFYIFIYNLYAFYLHFKR